MQDCCHELDLAIEDICRLPEIKKIIALVREILAYMSRSVYAREQLDIERERLGISRGLESIVDTRFGTVYWAGASVERNLDALRAIAANNELGVQFPVRTLIISIASIMTHAFS